jgi:hypothetical protein
MAWLLFKYLTTAALVVLISEAAKRSDKLGAAIGALPIITVLALVWLHVEGQPQDKLANHASLTLWYVLPTLPMFALFPKALASFGFWPALAFSAVLTGVLFFVTAMVARVFGVNLLP